MSEELLISDAAKEVRVESHVLRYWEEELGLSIQRNEWGHRFYTKEDINRLKRIKDLKERGLQLKAIKMLMMAGRLEAFERGGYELGEEKGMAIEILEVRDAACEEMVKRDKNERKSDVTVPAEDSVEEEMERGVTVEGMSEEEMECGVTVEGMPEEEMEREASAEGAVEKEAVEIGKVTKEVFEEKIPEGILPRRDEAYFKKIDQLLRDKSFSQKKKRHFIF